MPHSLRRFTPAFLAAALLVLAAASAAANGAKPSAQPTTPGEHSPDPQHAAAAEAHAVFRSDAIKWQDGPPSLPKGAKIAVLEGDPREEGIFTMRLRLPDGFQIKPHWHPAPERITVLSGTFNMGRRDSFDTAQGTALPAGSFTVIPAETWHYAWATGDTVLQITGGGPWQIIYLDPRDDPRKRGK